MAELFKPQGETGPSDFPMRNPIDGYGAQMLPGYGQEPQLEPYRSEKKLVANKRSKLSERD
jgi:hypothetical protein